MKKSLSLIFALVLIISLAVPAMASSLVTTTVNNNTGHNYEAYQIFDGTQSTSGSTLGTIQWGSGIDQSNLDALMAAVKAITLEDDSKPFADCESAADVAEALSGKAVNAQEAILFGKVVNQHLSNTSYPISKDATSVDVDPGYYLLVDVDTPTGEGTVTGLSLLQITGHEFTITSKTGRPTVEKSVQDEVADMDSKSSDPNGWGDTADHAIDESFQFELMAEIPSATNLKLYEEYMIRFQDTMSKGITFEEIVSVTVNDVPIAAYSEENTNGYKLSENAVNGAKGPLAWNLTIDDILPYVDNPGNRVTVKVIYEAHLNSDAAVGNVDTNKNTVYLEYSNNPNADGEGEFGKTPTDTVWVFTYSIDSVKYKNAILDENVLEGAGFTLYTEAEYAKYAAGDETAQPVLLDQDPTTKNYHPHVEGVHPESVETVTEMFSDANGKFNVQGLDVGIYYLVETTVPGGYNQCADIKVEIKAMHYKDVSATTALTQITMTQDDNSASALKVNIINNAGATLPETGGIGTTIFYIVGAVLVLGAVVMLITKKRMTAEE